MQCADNIIKRPYGKNHHLVSNAPQTSVGLISIILESLETMGVSRGDVINQVGLAEHQLSMGHGFLDANYIDKIVIYAANKKQCPPEEIAIKCGLKASFNTYGMLGMAAMSAPTLGEALRIASQYFSLVTTLFELGFEEVSDGIVLPLSSNYPLDDQSWRINLYLILGAGSHMVKTLVGGSSRSSKGGNKNSVKIMLPFARPNDEDILFHSELNTDCITFAGSKPSLFISQQLANIKLPTSNNFAAQYATKECEALINHNHKGLSGFQAIELIKKMIIDTEYSSLSVEAGCQTVEHVNAYT